MGILVGMTLACWVEKFTDLFAMDGRGPSLAIIALRPLFKLSATALEIWSSILGLLIPFSLNRLPLLSLLPGTVAAPFLRG